jgi:hypothetical protein
LFGCFLGLRSFDNPLKPLACKQAFLLITKNGIGLILTTTITLVIYLGSWALVVSIIAIKFMVDQHPFLFESLAQIDNNTCPFQQHFKVACDLLLPLACECLLPFEQLIK